MRSQPQSAQEIKEVIDRVLNEQGYLVDSNNESIVRQEIMRSQQNFFGEVAIKDCIRLHADEMNKKPREGRTIKRYPRIPTDEELAQIAATVLAENPWVADSDKNGELLADWIEKNAESRFTVENYRVAIQVLKNQLDRRPPAPPAPPQVPETPTEVLEKLPNGEMQLSLSTPEWKLRQASKAQLRDFLRRAKQ
jgi:hypothetical protein